MCSRYTLTSPAEAVRSFFDCEPVEDFPPRYNIAPTDPVLIAHAGVSGSTVTRLVRWGLIPAWAKDPRALSTLINARSEGVSEKPSFRGAFRHRRCLVPASGFYEWTGEKRARRPHVIRLKDHQLFAFAGIWETWLGADGSEIDTMAILTTVASPDMAQIHDRMPVILAPSEFARWLDCRPGTGAHVMDLLGPLPDGMISITPVNPRLNDPRLEGPELLIAESETTGPAAPSAPAPPKAAPRRRSRKPEMPRLL